MISFSKDNQFDEIKQRQERINNAFDVVMRTNDGRKVLKFLLDLVPIDQECFSLNSEQTAFNLGKRDLGIQIRNYIKNQFGQDILSSIDNEVL